MSGNLGPGTQAPPPALRASRSVWRDPRLWIGILLVAGSVVVGARVLAAADDTVAVWAYADPVPAGGPLAAADVVATRVRFADADDLTRYFPADEPWPDGLVATSAGGAGELVPRSGVGPAGDQDLMHLSIEVPPGQLPTSVEPGSVIDVYLHDVGAGRISDDNPSGLVLDDVSVVDLPSPGDSFVAVDGRQVVVAVDPDVVTDFETALNTAQDPVFRVAAAS